MATFIALLEAMPLLLCAKSCKEILEAAFVSLKRQFLDERARAIYSQRIGIVFYCVRFICKSFREKKNRRLRFF
jgi:hypothetical protein